MPEQIDDKNIYSLLEVTRSIQRTLETRYSSSFWVKAEMNKLNYYKQSGHCYPDLVEKVDGKVIAQLRSNLWARDYTRINNNFQQVLNEPLKDGIKILFQAKISFDPVYGMALTILDIDPAYTLGDLEQERLEAIRKLKEQQLYHRNKTTPLPLLPQRLAIISVDASKGYADFLRVIDNNPWGYKFFHFLFPSILQGDKAIPTMLNQLARIKKIKHHFDVVAIIRGGGGDVGLSCYNNYELSKAIAEFPLPVITGIGHATNETVSELVSYYNAITPTKLGEFLLQKFHNFSVPVKEAERRIVEESKQLLSEAKAAFLGEIKLFRSVTETILSGNRNNLVFIKKTVKREAQLFIGQQQQQQRSFASTLRSESIARLQVFQHALSRKQDALRVQSILACKQSMLELNHLGKQLDNMSPSRVLERGYSITLVNGKAVKSINDVKTGDQVKTIVADGTIDSNVANTTNNSTNG